MLEGDDQLSENRKCVKCDEPVYASYKTEYFCVDHLREILETKEEHQTKSDK
jgi:hypothetical protein